MTDGQFFMLSITFLVPSFCLTFRHLLGGKYHESYLVPPPLVYRRRFYFSLPIRHNPSDQEQVGRLTRIETCVNVSMGMPNPAYLC